MDASTVSVLTPYNYFEWKSKIKIYLKRHGYYRVTMGLETEPQDDTEKIKWFNKCDEAFGTLCMSVSPDLLFHIESATTPNEVWTKLETLFGKQDELRGHQLENELIGLSPTNFDTIQDFFTKLKSIRLQLKQCGIEKEDKQLILSILSKLGPNYSVFVSTFYATKSALGSNYKMPSLDEFSVELAQEQDKLVHMGTIKPSKSHALVANQGTKEQKGFGKQEKKQKNQGEKKKDQKPIAPNTDNHTSSSKGDQLKKEKVKCSYCKRPGHDEHKCLKKQIDHLSHLLEKNNIKVPDSIKQSSLEGSSKDTEKNKGKGKGKALVAVASQRNTWIIDLGASHHMASSQENFASIEPCTMPAILMGDDTPVEVHGRGAVDVGEGTFQDVLCVPSLSTNLLSVYQITHTGFGKRVEFTPDNVAISELHDGSTVAMGKSYHQSRLYQFSHFVPDSPSTVLLTHSDEVSHLWHQRFGHLNYRYL